MDKYAVIGNPIAHSKSPQIHQMFAQQADEDIMYEALLSPTDEFKETVEAFRKGGGMGLNVTVPFKQEAWELADELSDYAKKAGAVNTLVFREDGTIYGTNTDGIGLVRDLVENHYSQIQGKRILILGAGGAVRGILQPLLMQLPSQIFIANRTPERATELVADMQELAQQNSPVCDLAGGGFNDIEGEYDLIINGTAASLQGIMPPIPESCLASGVHCYDMMYGGRPTAFEFWCEDHGAAKVMNGLGMLVEQAAESFSIWRTKMPDTKPVLEAMQLSWLA
ncbi:shikimate dehydrogenase [uncultured Cocleimonas sp.]|uniref:shikimate dehydrogenase n=1 Tax=uncultured Cocleimonas sp. TaxID=1051587 RepID=UPI002632867A|nr:shikimate dehydrogenase [uncultured Cocleimonas sp.]